VTPLPLIVSRKRTLATQRMLGHGAMEVFARGRGPCVVAMHGFTGTAGELGHVLTAIGDAGYALDAALLPGHGTGAQHLQDTAFEDWLAASRRRVQDAIAAHGRVVVLGFSLGSLLAMQIASERPPGLAGLVVMGNALTLGLSSRAPLGLWARSRRAMPDIYLVKPRPGDLADRTHEDRILTYDRHPLRAALEVFRAGERVRAVVGRIDCPTLIQHGRRDLVCPWSAATWLASRLGTRDVSIALYERSAHVLGWDGEREQVAREVLTFLSRIA
jgi:carboxylesterase